MPLRTSVADVILIDEPSTIADTEAGPRWSSLTVALLVAVGIAGLVLRILVLRSPAGLLGADEAYTGVQSFEILGGQFPIVLGGTVYTLPLEAYLYAPIAAILGSNIVALKLVSTASWALASVVVAVATTRLATRRSGLIAGSFCWLTPGALLVISVTAYSAYASGLLVSVSAFYVAARVVDADAPNRWLAALFGVLAGFGFWLHPMFLASLVPMAAVVLWTHRRRVATIVAVVVGGIVGCAPLLAWNVVNAWPSLERPIDVEGTYLDRIRTFAVDLVPRAFGLRDGILDWQPNGVVAPILYLTLITTAIAGCVLLVRRDAPRSKVLLPAVLVGVFPIMALFENLIFADDGRYGIIAFPFIVIAIAITIDELLGRASARRTLTVAIVVGLVWTFGFIVPTVRPLVDATDGNPNARFEAVVDRLDEAGIDRIYGSYWAVHSVEFVGDRRIVAGVFPFWPIRFPDRQRIVGATPIDEVAVLFLAGDEDPGQLPAPPDEYERVAIGEFVLYLPRSAAPAG